MARAAGAVMRVGLNLVYLVEDSGGSGRYARELIPAMLEREPGLELVAWVGSSAPESLWREPWAAEVQWQRLPVPGIGTPWHLWYELAGIGVAARAKRLDVLHGLANLVPVVSLGDAARVVTILDVIWMHYPEAMALRARVAMRTLAPLCGHRAHRVIAISDAAAVDVSQMLRIPAARFDVTPLGMTLPGSVAPSPQPEMRARLALRDGPLVLCVAAKRAHKNLNGLIRAFAALPEQARREPRPQLVLPGSPTDYESELRSLAAQLGLEDDVVFPAWVSEPDLEALYTGASAFVLPSMQEGFGLPVLEAMVRGVPVACSDTSSLPEVAGDAALLFDPRDIASIAAALGRLLTEPQLAAELVAKGRLRASEFTWTRTAELTLASYRRAIDAARR